MRQQSVLGIQRIFLLISFLALIGLLAIAADRLGYWSRQEAEGIPVQGFVWAAFRQQVALISGHAGYDSGAICQDETGNTRLIEADVVAKITQLAARRLQRAGATVTILQEFDPRLDNLQADLLLSIHADSCVDASGYKAARSLHSPLPQRDDRLIDCIEKRYSATTSLPLHENSITHNMTEYHAYGKIAASTPAAILEVGFLGGDGSLLTDKAPLVAQGIADSILCFLQTK